MGEHVARHARAQGGGRGRLRLRQQHPRRGAEGGRRRRLRHPRLRARVHPPAVLRGQGPVPLGRALGRSRGHRAPPTTPCSSTFPDDAALARWITLARERVKPQGLPARICWLGYGERAKLGRVFNELVRSGARQGADRDRPRPPRLRLGRVAQPRDRGDEGRLRRHRRLADPERAAQHRRRRDLGLRPPRRRRRHRLLAPRRHGRRRRRHAARPRPASSACSPPTPAWASCATPTPATRRRSRSPARGASTSRCCQTPSNRPPFTGGRRCAAPPRTETQAWTSPPQDPPWRVMPRLTTSTLDLV